jgi:signal transduction histidine kinase
MKPASGRACEGDQAKQHVWVSLLPWWHAAFAATVLVTAGFGALELAATWRLYTVMGLYAALVLLYLSTPGKFAGSRAGNVYLLGAFVLFVVASFIFPGSGFLMFVLIPQSFALMGLRPAYVAVIGMVAANGGGELAYSGANSATAASVAGFGAFSILMSVLLGGYISRIIEQSKQRAALIEELERTRSELAELSRESGALAERERLAREIHDALAQGFTSVIMLLQAAQASLERGDVASARRQLALAEPAARDGLAEARSLIDTLSPLPLQGTSLVGAVERVSSELGARMGFAAKVEVSGSAQAISHNAEIVLLRAAQVALVNVGRHSRARAAAVRLTFDRTTACLEVSDEGVGFDAAQKAGFGLSQLRSRAGEIGGTTEVISVPGEGTTVRVTVPVGVPEATAVPVVASSPVLGSREQPVMPVGGPWAASV